MAELVDHGHGAGWRVLDLVVAFAVGALVGLLAITLVRARGSAGPAVPDTPADLIKEE